MKILPCRKIQIEITNVCNYDCDICPRKKLKVPIKHMELATFKKILRNIDSIAGVDLTGWGEPLSHPDFYEMLKLLKAKGKNVTFTTNASLLRLDGVEEFNKYGLKGLAISLDNIKDSSSHGSDSINNNLSLLKNYQGSIRFQTTLIGQKVEELLQIARLAIKFGANEYRLIRLDQRLLDEKIVTAPEKENVGTLRAKLRGQIRVTMAQYGIFGDWRDTFYRPAHKLLGDYCPKLISSAYANVDGYLTPCCSLPLLRLGDLKEHRIDALWRSTAFEKFRKNHSSYCESCQVLTR